MFSLDLKIHPKHVSIKSNLNDYLDDAGVHGRFTIIATSDQQLINQSPISITIIKFFTFSWLLAETSKNNLILLLIQMRQQNMIEITLNLEVSPRHLAILNLSIIIVIHQSFKLVFVHFFSPCVVVFIILI